MSSSACHRISPRGYIWVPATIVLLACRAEGACRCEDCQRLDGEAIWAGDEAGDEKLCVVGDLLITERTEADLAALSQVAEVTGSLIIDENPTMRELTGWSTLSRIGGSLSVSNNAGLVKISGFGGLAVVGGGFYVAENPVLGSIAAGDALERLESLEIVLNPRLQELSSLAALTTVSGRLELSTNELLDRVSLPALEQVGSMSLLDCERLATLDVPSLSRVGGDLLVQNSGLSSLAGFPALSRVTGDLLIVENQALLEVELESPWAVSGLMYVNLNENLTRLYAGPEATLSNTTKLTVALNPRLAEIAGFAGVRALAKLRIAENNELLALPAWESLDSLSRLEISHHPVLVVDSGWFPALLRAESVWIYGNSAMNPSLVQALIDRVEVTDVKVGDNGGEQTDFDPCPWLNDQFCDEEFAGLGYRGSGLCASDPGDCTWRG